MKRWKLKLVPNYNGGRLTSFKRNQKDLSQVTTLPSNFNWSMLCTSPIRNYEDDQHQLSTKTSEVNTLKQNCKKAVDVLSTEKTELTSDTYYWCLLKIQFIHAFNMTEKSRKSSNADASATLWRAQTRKKNAQPCHERNIYGRKGKIKTCRRHDSKNKLLDAFNVIERKTRRYSKTLQQNIWKTVSILVTKSWVQAKNVRKWCHHKNQRIFQQDEKSARQNRVNARALSLWCIADDFIVILAISCSWRLKHRSVEAS